jgi:HEAT repeat protein
LLDAVDATEEAVVALLQDEDHVIRAEAAATLAAAHGEASRRALEDALNDRSETVKDAAIRSLRSRAEFVRWQQALADPRD